MADDLASVTSLLARESVLTRHLADPADDPTPKLNLLETLLEGKVGDTSLEVLKAAVSGRWSSDANLVDAVEHVARLALLVRAEREQWQATSKSNSSGSAASSMRSRGWPVCLATTARPPRAASSCYAMSLAAAPG